MGIILPIRTQRLELIPATAVHLRAAIDDRHKLEELLGATIPDNWPPETLAEVLPLFCGWLTDNPELFGWLMYHWVYEDRISRQRTLIGDGGFKTAPKPDGSIEIGYAVLSQFHGRGFATEAARAMIDMAFSQDSVNRIIGETLPDNAASIRVLEKLGFGCIGPGAEPGHLQYELRKK